MADSSQLPQQSSSLSFTQGFMLGQVSVVILIFVFIKFFIFGESPSSNDYHLRHHARFSRAVSFSSSNNPYKKAAAKSRSSVLRHTGPVTTSAILSKTYYNVRNHQPESVDWFNVLIAQTIAQFRNDAQQDNAILTSINDLLNGERKPDFLDEIKVTELSLGEEFPIFSNCRVIPVDDPPSAGNPSFASAAHDGSTRSRPTSSAGGPDGGVRLQARMDVDLSDAITLGIETKVVLNYPVPFVAAMPVALAVTVVRFSGTLSISFIPSPPSTSQTTSATKDGVDSAPKSAPTTLTFSFDPSYRLELSTHSLLGSRSRLQDIPKIAQLVESRLHAWIDERCVEPRFQRVVLPSLWPRRGNVGTRGESVFEGDGDGSNDSKKRGVSMPEPQETGQTLESMREQQAADGLRWRRERNFDDGYNEWDETERLNMTGSMPGTLPP